MGKLPLLKALDLAKILKKVGFEVVRQEGSHMFLKHPDGRTTVVPNHPGEHIDRGLLTKIVKKDVGIEREDFVKLLRKK
jgi:predicted RNA binding protein YcfA (HicA-like mRNA interferase family)